MLVIYTKSHGRRPVRWGLQPVLSDRQAAIPVCWCCRCGMEVFRPGCTLCDRCGKEK